MHQPVFSMRFVWIACSMFAFSNALKNAVVHVCSRSKRMESTETSPLSVIKIPFEDRNPWIPQSKDSFDLETGFETLPLKERFDLEVDFESCPVKESCVANLFELYFPKAFEAHGMCLNDNDDLRGLNDSGTSWGCTFSRRSNSSIVGPSLSYHLTFSSSFVCCSLCFLFAILSLRPRFWKPLKKCSKQFPTPVLRSTIPKENPKGVELLLDLEAPLSSGKRSNVYRGTYGHKTVAVKVSNKSGTLKDACREPSEVKHLRILQHPGIVSLEFSGSYMDPQVRSRISQITSMKKNGLPYESFVVMEYCDKGTLHRALKNDLLSFTADLGQTTKCALEVAKAVAYMHSKNIVHGALHAKHIFLHSNSADPRGFHCKVILFDIKKAKTVF